MASDITGSASRVMDAALFHDLGAASDSAGSSRAHIKRGSNPYVLNDDEFM